MLGSQCVTPIIASLPRTVRNALRNFCDQRGIDFLEIVFYDEPGAGLDPITASVIDHLMMDLSKKLKMTSVVVTHEMRSAFRIADRMVVLESGKVVAYGRPDEIKNSDHPYVQQFIHGDIDGPISFKETKDNYLKQIFGHHEE